MDVSFMSESVVNLEIEGLTSHVFPFRCKLRLDGDQAVDEMDQQKLAEVCGSLVGSSPGSEIVALTPPFLRSELTEVEALSFDFRKEVADRFHPKNYNNGPLILECYRLILRTVYQLDVRYQSLDHHSTLIIHDKDGYHLYRYELDPRFIKVRLLDPQLRLLEQNTLNELRRVNSPDQLMSMLPPENFEFSGFGMWRRRRFDLFRNFSILNREIRENETHVVEMILQWVQENCGMSHAEIGISIKHDQFLRRYSTPEIQRGSLRSMAQSFKFSDIINHETATIFTENQFAVFSKSETVGPYYWLDAFNEKKYDLVTILPLSHQGNIIGLIDLSANESLLQDKSNFERMIELKSYLELLIANQLTRELSEIEATIRKQCTAIHSVVEWKFHDVAKNYNRSKTKGLRMPPIIFRDVYPLFGVSVIDESSDLQRQSIQEDFKNQLYDLQQIFQQALHSNRIPYLEHLLFEVNHMHQQIQSTIEPGDETTIIGQLRERIHPALEMVRRQSEDLEDKVRTYLKKIHNEVGGNISFREEFNQSVHQINESIMLYLHQEQAGAQRVVPHYFDKKASFGVRHTMFVGRSLLKEQNQFHLSQLANLRLWQLLIMCGSARRVAMLQEKLSVKFRVAHMILVQDSPVTIYFDYDEKKLVLQGHESSRYELLKKRIRKATIKGQDETLAKPHTLSVVFTNDRERHEYMNYIHFLQWKGYLNNDVEEFLLEDLKGLHGLRALRTSINTDKPEYSNLDITQVSMNGAGVEWL